MSKIILLLLGLFLFSLRPAQSAVLGIDFGSEFFKVASIKPGTGFHIVLDEQAKRKVPVIVAFDETERLFGNNALGLNIRRPKDTYMYAHRLLGKTFDHPEVAAFQKQFPNELLPIEGRNTVGFSHFDPLSGNKSILTVEEVVAQSLEHIMRISEADAGVPVKDAVITVPPFWTQAERQALLDAAEIAGLNVLSLINDNTAAALQYAIDHKMSDIKEPFTLVIYNMGSTSTKATLVVYSTYAQKIGKKEKIIGQFEVLGHAWDTSLGGSAFEDVLTQWAAEQVNQELSSRGDSFDVRSSPKIMAKIRVATEKAKTVLSANKDTFVVLGSLYNDMDFKFHITRQKFYELAAPLLQRVGGPFETLLQQAGKSKSDVNSIVIIGGSVRIPAVQDKLKKAAGVSNLAQNLNGDEASCMGASFRAANLSTAFQVRQIGLVDVNSFGIGVRFSSSSSSSSSSQTSFDESASASDGDESVPAPEDEAASSSFSKRASIFPRNNKLDKRKTVAFHLPLDSSIEDLRCSIFYEPSTLPFLPPGTKPILGEFNITGFVEFLKDEKVAELVKSQKPKVSVTFLLDSSNIVSINKAQISVEEMVKVPVENTKKTKSESKAEDESSDPNKPRESKTEGSTGPDETQAEMTSPQAEDSTEKSASEPSATSAKEPEIEYKMKKKVHSFPLRVINIFSDLTPEEKLHVAPPVISAAEKVASRQLLRKLLKRDQMKHEIAASRNKVESFIYKVRELLTEEETEEISTEEQRQQILDVLAAAEDWLYDQKDDSPVPFNNKFSELEKSAADLLYRLDQKTKRPEAVSKALEVLNNTKHLLASMEKKPWIPEEDKQKLKDMYEGFSRWLLLKEEEQESRAPYEMPAFSSDEVIAEMQKVAKFALELSKRKPPPPPKKEQKPKETSTTNGSDGAKDDETAEKSSNEQPQTEEGQAQKATQERTTEQSETDEMKPEL